MRRCLTSFALALLCAGTSAAQQKKSHREAQGLSGPVRSIRTEYAQRTTEGGKTVESPRQHRRLTLFDERGDMLEVTTYDHKGAVSSRAVNGRDAQGRAVSFNYDGEGKLVNRRETLFNDEGKPAGHLTYGPDGELKQKVVDKHNPDGSIAEQEIYDAGGALLYKNLFVRDERGQQIAFEFHDATGRLLDKTLTPNGVGKGFHTAKYDAGGGVEFEQTTEAGVVEEVDARGNWIRQSARVKSAQNGHAREYVSVTYRTIEYFDSKRP